MSYILHIKVESSASNLLLTRGEWERYEMENLDTGLVTDWDEEWEEGNKEWCAEPARPTVDISDDSPEKVSYCDQEVPMAKEDVPVAMPPVASGGTTAPCADNASPIPKDDDSFVLTMLQDPDLPCDPDMALKVYRFLQGKAGSQLTEALKNSGEHAQPPMPKEPQMPSSHGKSGDNPPSSTTPQRIEKYYEDWNSSQSVTSAGSVWESPEEEMEEKIARVAPKDAKAVALYHEINKEKKLRRAAHLKRMDHEPKVGKHAYHAWYSTGGSTNHDIKWGPITKSGRSTFMAFFGQENPELDVAGMELHELVDFALSEAPKELPDSIPENIAQSIRYIQELASKWGVYDYEDIDWWLCHEWGPLFFGSSSSSMNIPALVCVKIGIPAIYIHIIIYIYIRFTSLFKCSIAI